LVFVAEFMEDLLLELLLSDQQHAHIRAVMRGSYQRERYFHGRCLIARHWKSWRCVTLLSSSKLCASSRVPVIAMAESFIPPRTFKHSIGRIGHHVKSDPICSPFPDILQSCVSSLCDCAPRKPWLQSISRPLDLIKYHSLASSFAFPTLSRVHLEMDYYKTNVASPKCCSHFCDSTSILSYQRCFSPPCSYSAP
jgi:hypothetical protein